MKRNFARVSISKDKNVLDIKNLKLPVHVEIIPRDQKQLGLRLPKRVVAPSKIPIWKGRKRTRDDDKKNLKSLFHSAPMLETSTRCSVRSSSTSTSNLETIDENKPLTKKCGQKSQQATRSGIPIRTASDTGGECDFGRRRSPIKTPLVQPRPPKLQPCGQCFAKKTPKSKIFCDRSQKPQMQQLCGKVNPCDVTKRSRSCSPRCHRYPSSSTPFEKTLRVCDLKGDFGSGFWSSKSTRNSPLRSPFLSTPILECSGKKSSCVRKFSSLRGLAVPSLPPKCEKKDRKHITCHRNPSILDRSSMSQKEYMDMLSTPKRRVPECVPKKCEKCPRTDPCSPRLIQMARPIKRRVLATWQAHHQVLSTQCVTRLNELLQGGDCRLQPKEASSYFHTLRRKRKPRSPKRCKCGEKQKLLWLKCQTELTAKAIVNLFGKEPLYLLNFTEMVMSEEILNWLQKRNVVDIGCRSTKNMYKKTIIDFCDKIATWIDKLNYCVNLQPHSSKEQIDLDFDVESLVLSEQSEEESEDTDEYEGFGEEFGDYDESEVPECSCRNECECVFFRGQRCVEEDAPTCEFARWFMGELSRSEDILKQQLKKLSESDTGH
mgnify:CR=1 FL=1